MNTRYRCALVATLLGIAGCSSSTPSEGAVTQFYGESTDAVGDTAGVLDGRVPRPADIVFASVLVTNTAIHFTVRFAPGSFDAATTGASFLLDTDRDSTSGAPSLGVGAEYSVDFRSAPSREVQFSQAVTDPGCSAPCRFQPFGLTNAVLTTDQMDATIPRSALATFDGRLNFRVVTYAMLDGGRETWTTDHMPNPPAQFIPVR